MGKEILLDAHTDVLMDVLHFRKNGEHNVLEKRYLPIFKSGRINAFICSIFIEDALLPEGALRNALDQISALTEDIQESKDYFAVCRTSKDAYIAIEEGKIALFLSLEGAEPIMNDLLLLRTFYDLGVRLLGITWSRRNYAADGSALYKDDTPVTPCGLTAFGRELVVKAQKLGMVIDVSHINDPGFFETESLMTKPFIASHSNCRALAPVPRNLTDEQIVLLAKSGGVIGINAYSPFSSANQDEQTPEKLIQHIDHIIEIAGHEHVGLGLDLCDCLPSLRNSQTFPSPGDIFFDHGEVYEKFIIPICSRYSQDVSKAILGGNFMRVLEEIFG